jgi:transcriptional regulator with XRE-family HTH domain
LGRFLRARRGEMTLAQFARKLGIASSSLHRLELGEQNVTLDTLELILKRLHCSLSDVFDVESE